MVGAQRDRTPMQHVESNDTTASQTITDSSRQNPNNQSASIINKKNEPLAPTNYFAPTRPQRERDHQEERGQRELSRQVRGEIEWRYARGERQIPAGLWRKTRGTSLICGIDTSTTDEKKEEENVTESAQPATANAHSILKYTWIVWLSSGSRHRTCCSSVTTNASKHGESSVDCRWRGQVIMWFEVLNLPQHAVQFSDSTITCRDVIVTIKHQLTQPNSILAW